MIAIATAASATARSTSLSLLNLPPSLLEPLGEHYPSRVVLPTTAATTTISLWISVGLFRVLCYPKYHRSSEPVRHADGSAIVDLAEIPPLHPLVVHTIGLQFVYTLFRDTSFLRFLRHLPSSSAQTSAAHFAIVSLFSYISRIFGPTSSRPISTGVHFVYQTSQTRAQ